MFTRMQKRKIKKKNWNSNGFSLIEVVIVVAIMAVLITVISPIMFQYVERSKANRDLAAMDEATGAFNIGMTNFNVYDEIIKFSRENNVSCYIDTPNESGYEKIITETLSNGAYYYTFDSSARQADETPYAAAGKMYGMTVTFEPYVSKQGESQYIVRNGIINKFMQPNDGVLGQTTYLYEYVQKVLGDTITIDSNTYKNSDLTIFINAGEMIEAYGQNNGTNLPDGDYDPTLPPYEEPDPTTPPTERPTEPVVPGLKNPSVTLTAIQRIYNGQYQEIVSYSNLVGGTIKFYASKSDVEPSFSQVNNDVCEALDAGKYHVWYKIIADSNGEYNSTGVLYYGEVEVEKADPSVVVAPIGGLICTGSDQDLVTCTNFVGDDLRFYVSTTDVAPEDDAITSKTCRAKDASTYYIWYKIINYDESNYKQVDAVGPLTAEINHDIAIYTSSAWCNTPAQKHEYCVCGYSHWSNIAPALGHAYNEYGTAGSTFPCFVCTRCGHTYYK